jgi:lysozyme family protein
VFDAAVNSGPGRAAKWLQACVGVEQDGGIGPKTLAAAAAFDPAELVEDYAKRRLSFLMDLPHWGPFGKGWGRRVAAVQTVATSMAA